MIALNIQAALVRWRDSAGEPHTVRHLRVVPPATAALGAAWLLRSVQQTGGSSFWFALRLALNLVNGIRLAVVFVLHALDVAPGSFPPGKLSYESALRFNFGCLALATFVLSPSSRSKLSTWTGGECVVLQLREISRTMATSHLARMVDATDAPHSSNGLLSESADDALLSRSCSLVDEGTGYSESLMSTFLVEDDRDFHEPFNTLDNHPEYSSLWENFILRK
jgi:hypothetical protein